MSPDSSPDSSPVPRLPAWLPRLPEEPLPDGMTVAMKAEFIRQEHRFIALCGNFLRYWHIDPADPRRSAALEAALWRLFSSPAVAAATVGGLSLMTAVATIYLGYQANVIADQQSQMLEKQTLVAEQQATQAMIQNALAEAQRMATLAQQIDPIAEKLEQFRPPPAGEFPLEQHQRVPALLEASVINLSRALRPYRALQWFGSGSPSLTAENFSRERGQLLLVCLAADEVPSTNDEPILQHPRLIKNLSRADFSYADLSNISLRWADLRELNLEFANFEGSTLDRCGFVRSQLGGAKCANVRWGQDSGAVCLVEARAMNADFTQADLRRVDARRAQFQKANFENANMSEIDLSEANLMDANLRGSHLEGANFSNAVLPSPEQWKEATLSKAKFEGSFVLSTDWLKIMLGDPKFAPNFVRYSQTEQTQQVSKTLPDRCWRLHLKPSLEEGN